MHFAAPRNGDLAGMSEKDIGSCFVKYDDVASAIKAFKALNGREFDGNTVQVSYRQS